MHSLASTSKEMMIVKQCGKDIMSLAKRSIAGGGRVNVSPSGSRSCCMSFVHSQSALSHVYKMPSLMCNAARCRNIEAFHMAWQTFESNPGLLLNLMLDDAVLSDASLKLVEYIMAKDGKVTADTWLSAVI